MKKKLLSITTILIMIVALFISCSNEVQTGDKVSKVLFTSDDNMTRGLNSSSPSFAVEQYYWTYEAQKMDNSGLKTGETEGPVPVIKVEAGQPEVKGLDASVGPFSLGNWKFTLQAHEGSTSGNVLYTGVASNVVITDNPEGNKVSIKVHPLQDGHGYVEIAEGIGLKDSYGNPVLEYTEKITFSKAATPDVVETLAKPEGRVYTVPAGSWKVTIAYLSTSNPDIAYGRNSIYVNVFDNQKVVIGGSLEEITGNTSFETTVDGGTKAIAAPVQVKASEGVKLEVSSSPAAPESTAAKTEIQIPANALKSEGEAKLSVTSYDSPAASKFVVTEDNSTALAGLDIDLKIADTAVTEFNTPVTVSTYIAKGLIETPKVVYNGGGADMQPDPNTVTYNKETGLLTFQTTHFSQYFVVADVEAIDVTNNIAYATLKDALYNGDKSASVKIVLLKDVISSEGGEVGKWNVYGSDVELDMNGHTITDSFVADIISEYPLITINVESKLTIKNGAIISKGNREAVIRVSGDTWYKAPELVFDHVNINKDENIQETLGPVVLIVGNGKAHFISGDIKWNSLQGAIKTHGNKTENAEIVFENGMNVDGIIYLPGKNDVTFNGGTYTSDYTVVYQKSGSLTINDGTFIARNADNNWQHMGSGMESTGNPVIVEACGYTGGNPIVTINGGKFFTGVSEVQPLVIDWRANELDAVNNADVTGIKVPYNYANLVGNGNIALGVENVSLVNAGVIEVSDLTSLKTAFNNVKQGQTIRLMADIGHNGTLQIPQNVTIDYNGHKICDHWDGSITDIDTIKAKVVQENENYKISVDNPSDLAAALSILGSEQNSPYNPSKLIIDITKDMDLAYHPWPAVIMQNASFILNGNGHVISNLNFVAVGTGETDTAGFIAYAGAGSHEINNLTLRNVKVVGATSGNVGVGGFIGTGTETTENTLNDCHIIGGTITGGKYTGGILGYNRGSVSCTDCSIDGVTIDGAGTVGGILGYASAHSMNKDNVLKNCVVKNSTLKSSKATTIRVGSLIGTIGNDDCILDNCSIENVTCLQNGIFLDSSWEYGRKGNTGIVKDISGNTLVVEIEESLNLTEGCLHTKPKAEVNTPAN